MKPKHSSFFFALCLGFWEVWGWETIVARMLFFSPPPGARVQLRFSGSLWEGAGGLTSCTCGPPNNIEMRIDPLEADGNLCSVLPGFLVKWVEGKL